jgi:hypothetical protein
MAIPAGNTTTRYKAYIKQIQEHTAKAQAADPAWKAWQAEVSKYGPQDMDQAPPPPADLKNYAAEWFAAQPPAVLADYNAAHAAVRAENAKSARGLAFKAASVIPYVVAGAGVLSAMGVIGGAAGAAEGAAVAGAAEGATAGAAGAAEAASTLPLWDTGVGGLFGSQAATEAALTGAGWFAPATVEGGVAAAAAAGFDFSSAAGAAAAAGGGALDSVSGLVKSLGGVGGLVDAGLGVAGAIAAAQGTKDQAEEEQSTARFNAQEAELAAKNALLRGEEEARDLRRKGSLIEGVQRATFASRGVSLATGSPREAIEQTGLFTRQDMDTARKNAATEAATYRRQGSRFSSQASSLNPSRSAGLSLVSNLSSVAAKWYDRYSPFQA